MLPITQHVPWYQALDIIAKLRGDGMAAKICSVLQHHNLLLDLSINEAKNALYLSLNCRFVLPWAARGSVAPLEFLLAINYSGCTA